jgi:hypothetical protein
VECVPVLSVIVRLFDGVCKFGPVRIAQLEGGRATRQH